MNPAASTRNLQRCASLPPQRTAVRLLFAGFIVIATVLVLVRSVFGESYPGFFMPTFKGTGLNMVSATDATDVIPKFSATFADGTTTEIPEAVLFADIPQASIHRSVLYSICPNPDVLPFDSHRKGYAKWVTALFPGHFQAPPVLPDKIPADANAYFQQRLAKLYPNKVPQSMTISLYRATFPVAQFHDMTLQLLKQTVLSFHESI